MNKYSLELINSVIEITADSVSANLGGDLLFHKKMGETTTDVLTTGEIDLDEIIFLYAAGVWKSCVKI